MAISIEIFRNFNLIANSLKWTIQKEYAKRLLLTDSRSALSVITYRSIETGHPLQSEKKFKKDPGKIVKKDGTVIRKKTEPKTIIALLQGSKETRLPYSEALSIAEHKGLNLVKVDPPNIKTSFTYYRLLKDSELDVENTSKAKTMEYKTIIFTSSIYDNDLKIKVRQMSKVLSKQKGVHCIIKSLGNEDDPKINDVWEKIQQELQSQNVVYSFKPVNSGKKLRSFTIFPQTESDKPSKTEESDASSAVRNDKDSVQQ